jgi:hypothetical protein
MNRKIILLIVGVFVIITSVLLVRVLVDITPETTDDEDQDDLEDEILNEIDRSLLGEDDEIEIGNMV